MSHSPFCSGGAEEELRSVGVWSGICHRDDAHPRVPQREVLVLELVAVDRAAARAVVVGEVTALAHLAQQSRKNNGHTQNQGSR